MVGTSVAKAQEWLQKGEVVALPTETVYGLAGNAYRTDTLEKIFAIKDRPYFDPLIVHTYSIQEAESFVTHFPPQARCLAQAFWPGPLTLLLEKQPHIPDLATAGLPTVGVRIPQHPLTLKLLQRLSFPLAAPSANPFGYISPTTPQHVQAQLGHKIPYILDGGKCQIGLESTIVGFSASIPTIYRLGAVAIERIEKVIGPVNLYTPLQAAALPPSLVAPGTLGSHYAPYTPLLVGNLAHLLKRYGHLQVGTLSFSALVPEISPARQIVLSPGADLAEAAHHFFAALRRLDRLGLDLILASYVPDEGVGRAINERLRRASRRSAGSHLA